MSPVRRSIIPDSIPLIKDPEGPDVREGNAPMGSWDFPERMEEKRVNEESVEEIEYQDEQG